MASTAAAAVGTDTSKRGVAAFLAGNDGADYRALQRLTWFYNYGDNVRGFDPFRLWSCIGNFAHK